MSTVQQPFPSFNDLGGDPLDNGYIYIGIENQDPQTSPKQAYWDAAYTIPATQPIRTLGGFIVRNGSPANVYVDGAFSVTVRNRGGAVVSTKPSVDDEFVTASELAISTGAAGIGHSYPQAPAILKTLGAIANGDPVSINRWLTQAEINSVQNNTDPPDFDLTTKCQEACTVAQSLDWERGVYGVKELTITGSERNMRFKSAVLCGIATVDDPKTSILTFKGEHCNFYGLSINQNFNFNYGVPFWWYNAAASSQYNNFFGLFIRYAHMGMIFGAFPGSSSTGFAQSENNIFGYRTRGVERPVIVNHTNGLLDMTGCHLGAGNEEWADFSPEPFDDDNCFAFENYAGALNVNGGEVQNSIAATTSYCARVDGGSVRLSNTQIEVDVPFYVSGQDLTILGGQILNTQSVAPQFFIPTTANAKGRIRCVGTYMLRPAGTGSFSSQPLVSHVGAASSFDVELADCDIREWALLGNGDPRMIKRDNVRWSPTDSTTAALVNKMDDGQISLTEKQAIDSKGVTTNGWYIHVISGGGSSISLDTDVPNATFLNSLELVATGQAGIHTAYDFPVDMPLSATPAAPGDVFELQGWTKLVSGTVAGLSLACYDSAGAFLSFVRVTTALSTWNYQRAFVTAPASTAYVGFGMNCETGTARMAGVQARRAEWTTQ